MGLADRESSVSGNQANVSLQIETGVTLQVIPRWRAPSLARGQHHDACIPMSGEQCLRLVATQSIQDLAAFGAPTLELLDLLVQLDALGGALRLSYSPLSSRLEQVAQLADGPFVNRSRGRLRMAISKHVLEYESAIVVSKYRQPGRIGLFERHWFIVLRRTVVDRI